MYEQTTYLLFCEIIWEMRQKFLNVEWLFFLIAAISVNTNDGSGNENESEDEEISEGSSSASGTDSENSTSSEESSEAQEVRSGEKYIFIPLLKKFNH